MTEEKGRLLPSSGGQVWVQVELSNGLTIDCLLDTGFNGWLSWPREVVDYLNLPIDGQIEAAPVGKPAQLWDFTSADIVWLDEQRKVQVLVNEGTDTLVGTMLLTDTILRINYCTGQVSITPCKPQP